jgi:hypothetical protein
LFKVSTPTDRDYTIILTIQSICIKKSFKTARVHFIAGGSDDYEDNHMSMITIASIIGNGDNAGDSGIGNNMEQQRHC